MNAQSAVTDRWAAWIAEQRECIPPAPCGRGAGANGRDLPCDCEHFAATARAAYRLGVEDARAQVLAALSVEHSLGYVESGGIAHACEVVKALPRPEAS